MFSSFNFFCSVIALNFLYLLAIEEIFKLMTTPAHESRTYHPTRVRRDSELDHEEHVSFLNFTTDQALHFDEADIELQGGGAGAMLDSSKAGGWFMLRGSPSRLLGQPYLKLLKGSLDSDFEPCNVGLFDPSNDHRFLGWVETLIIRNYLKELANEHRLPKDQWCKVQLRDCGIWMNPLGLESTPIHPFFTTDNSRYWFLEYFSQSRGHIVEPGVVQKGFEQLAPRTLSSRATNPSLAHINEVLASRPDKMVSFRLAASGYRKPPDFMFSKKLNKNVTLKFQNSKALNLQPFWSNFKIQAMIDEAKKKHKVTKFDCITALDNVCHTPDSLVTVKAKCASGSSAFEINLDLIPNMAKFGGVDYCVSQTLSFAHKNSDSNPCFTDQCVAKLTQIYPRSNNTPYLEVTTHLTGDLKQVDVPWKRWREKKDEEAMICFSRVEPTIPRSHGEFERFINETRKHTNEFNPFSTLLRLPNARLFFFEMFPAFVAIMMNGYKNSKARKNRRLEMQAKYELLLEIRRLLMTHAGVDYSPPDSKTKPLFMQSRKRAYVKKEDVEKVIKKNVDDTRFDYVISLIATDEEVDARERERALKAEKKEKSVARVKEALTLKTQEVISTMSGASRATHAEISDKSWVEVARQKISRKRSTLLAKKKRLTLRLSIDEPGVNVALTLKKIKRIDNKLSGKGLTAERVFGELEPLPVRVSSPELNKLRKKKTQKK